MERRAAPISRPVTMAECPCPCRDFHSIRPRKVWQAGKNHRVPHASENFNSSRKKKKHRSQYTLEMKRSTMKEFCQGKGNAVLSAE
jgi:hypothetical protein